MGTENFIWSLSTNEFIALYDPALTKLEKLILEIQISKLQQP